MLNGSRKKSRNDDGFKQISSVNFEHVSDKQLLDKRFKREQTSGNAEDVRKGTDGVVMSSTFDAFQRMTAGIEGRTLADKLADPNRPTWEQYKKDNEDKLDLVGTEVKKMVEYRAQLDREREMKRKENTNRKPSETESDQEQSDFSESNDKKKGDSKKSKKHKSNRSEKKEKKKKSKHSNG